MFDLRSDTEARVAECAKHASYRRGAAALAVVVVLAACSRTPAPEAPAPAPQTTVAAPSAPAAQPARPTTSSVRPAAVIAESIFVLTNRERARANLAPLRRSPALMRAAQLQAEQMASSRKLAHDLPGTKYPTLAARLRLVAYAPRASAENIAEGYTSGAALVAGWMMSSGHRANILAPRFTETGVATARSRAGRTYHAQVFGQPR